MTRSATGSASILALAWALTGCLEAQPGRIAGLAGGVDAGGTADGAAGGDLRPGGPGQVCQVTSITVTRQGAEEAAGWPAMFPAAGEGAAWFTVPGSNGYASDVVRVEVATGARSPVISNTATTTLLDAREGALLVLHVPAGGAAGGVPELRYVAADGQVVSLDSGEALTHLVQDLALRGGPHRMVQRDSAAWAVDGVVKAWRPGVGTVTVGKTTAYGTDGPWLLGDHVAWSLSEQVLVGTLSPPGAPMQAVPVGLGPGLMPVLVDIAGSVSAVVVRAGGIWVAPLDGGEPTELHRGTCGRLTSDGRRVAFLCTPGDDGWLWSGGSELYVWEGRQARLVHQADPAVASLDAPALAGPLIAWMAYDDPAPCYPQGVGRLEVAAVDGGLAPVVVATTGTPCLCCNALWPLPAVAFDGHALAWNYASPEPAGGGGMGWAFIGWTERCQ